MTRLQTPPESATHRTDRLRALMAQAGISSFRELSRRAGVSQWQVRQVRTGALSNLRWGVLCQLSQALNLSPSQFVAVLEREPNPAAAQPSHSDEERESLKQEYQPVATSTEPTIATPTTGVSAGESGAPGVLFALLVHRRRHGSAKSAASC